MKLFSDGRSGLSPVKARNAALINQLATPGLGSLLAGRWVAGAGQLLLAVVGCGAVLVWSFKVLKDYYGGIGNADFTPLPSGNMGWIGALLFVLSWIWSGITSMSLLRSVTQTKGRSLESYAANLVKFDEARIIAGLMTLPQWQRRGEMITREYQFKDFPAAIKFVDAVAITAEQAWHHPDIDIRWNKVTLTLTTHDAGGLTSKDFDLARLFDELANPR